MNDGQIKRLALQTLLYYAQYRKELARTKVLEINTILQK